MVLQLYHLRILSYCPGNHFVMFNLSENVLFPKIGCTQVFKMTSNIVNTLENKIYRFKENKSKNKFATVLIKIPR